MQRHEAAPYLPHEGVMRLIDQIGECGTAYAAIRSDNPFLQPDGLPAWVGLEYMAQAVAAGHNLRNARGGAARPGVITSFRELEYARDWLDPALALTVRTELVHEDHGHAVHRCYVWQDGGEAAPLVSATVYTKENEA
jgi:predicted hotdog family 3-hydroxylacyl-ACP dehydratase